MCLISVSRLRAHTSRIRDIRGYGTRKQSTSPSLVSGHYPSLCNVNWYTKDLNVYLVYMLQENTN